MSDALAIEESAFDAHINGIRLSVHRFRAPDAPALPEKRTVLLLHGFLDAGSTWDLAAAPLARAGYDVFAPDLRGFGKSGRVPPGGYYYFPDYVADVDALVNEIAPSGWLAVVGHSMGGGVVSLWAGTRPERPSRVVIMEGLGPMGEPPELAVDRMRAWLRDLERIDRNGRTFAGGLDEAVERLAGTHPRIDRALLRSRAERLVVKDAEGRYAWAYDPLHRSRTPIPFQPEVFKAFLAQIACPALFVGGGETGWHTPDEDERIAKIPRAEKVELAGAGHMLHWTAPEDLGRELRRFFG